EDVWKPWYDLFRTGLQEREPKRSEEHTRWFYEVHHIEHLEAFLFAAAGDKTCAVGRALYNHLASHWPALRQIEFAVAALTDGNPGRRTEGKGGEDGEKVRCCENFWLWRLKNVAFCPTGHGPRLPSSVWQASREVERRFGRSGTLLPVLEVPEAGPL